MAFTPVGSCVGPIPGVPVAGGFPIGAGIWRSIHHRLLILFRAAVNHEPEDGLGQDRRKKSNGGVAVGGELSAWWIIGQQCELHAKAALWLVSAQ